MFQKYFKIFFPKYIQLKILRERFFFGIELSIESCSVPVRSLTDYPSRRELPTQLFYSAFKSEYFPIILRRYVYFLYEYY